MKYNNIISLGHFCSTALELERLGLRNASYPFDWIVTEDFENVINLIRNNFENFLISENLLYDRKNLKYVDKVTGVAFFHDFSEKKDFNNDFYDVENKYKRRIERFYKDIETPTLFLRYICNQKEYEYIEQNYDDIIKLLKSFNKDNDIIFISNDDIETNSVYVYKCKKDIFDSVARRFLSKNEKLKDYILNSISYNEEIRSKNIKRYRKILPKRKINKLKKSTKKFIRKLF